MGGLVAWATGGDFWQGAMQGGIIGALNHAQHENLDPIDNKTREKDRIREKIKNNLISIIKSVISVDTTGTDVEKLLKEYHVIE